MTNINEIENGNTAPSETTPVVSVENVQVPEFKAGSKVLGINWDHNTDLLFHEFKGIVEFAETLPINQTFIA